MLVEYDLEVQKAKELVEENLKKAPTKNMQAFYMVYLGMAKYYCGEYDEAIKTFNQIELKKLNPAYHILIFAFSAYASFELEDFENFNMYLERIKTLSANINRRYLSFVNSYIQVLEAIQGLDDNPEHYREVIESQFSQFDGYISTKLIYNFRMAYYYRAINDEVEMDKCLAKVIANGKNHHTAIRAKELFKNNVKVEDYVFQEEAPEEFNTNDEGDQHLIANQMDNVEDIEEVESVDDEE
jgi:tetratricopeptide (TPR) repeat protein